MLSFMGHREKKSSHCVKSFTRKSIITRWSIIVQHNVKGYEDFIKLVGELEGSGQPIHVLFSGGKDESGNSWCPYCVKGKHDMKTTNYV